MRGGEAKSSSSVPAQSGVAAERMKSISEGSQSFFILIPAAKFLHDLIGFEIRFFNPLDDFVGLR